MKGFFLSGLSGNPAYLAFFLFQMVFMDTAATIPTGAMAERLKFSGFVVMSLWVSMIIYPIFGNWVRGGGWLSGLGRTLGLGHGAVDFAGSSAVHMVGGMVGLAGALVLGLFADGSYGEGWNGVSGAVRGLFYGDGGQLLAQSIDVLVNVTFVFGLSYLFFKVLDRVMGLRSKEADEINGLDVPEMGTPGYADDELVEQPGALPRSKAPEFGTLPVTGK